MKDLQKQLYQMNKKIKQLNLAYNNRKTRNGQGAYEEELGQMLDQINDYLGRCFRQPIEEIGPLKIPYELIAEDALIDIFFAYYSLGSQETIVAPPNTTLYPLGFPYLGVRGPRSEIEQIFTQYLGKQASIRVPFILGNEPLNIRVGEFKNFSTSKLPEGLDGTNTLIGIIDTGIDYTNPAFIDSNGQTRIVGIWDQTIGDQSPYGYGTVYDQGMINQALASPEPFDLVPHQDEVGHGTILAGIAAGSGIYPEGTYKGVAPGAQLAIVKLKPANEAMQVFFHGKYNPLGFSALDIALAFQFLANLAKEYEKPISICLPMGTNSGSHDGTNSLDVMINSYSSNPGICTIIEVGEEANKGHHASGDLQNNEPQEIVLTIAKGQVGFLAEVWTMFGDRFEVFLRPPRLNNDSSPNILLNEPLTYRISETSSVWSYGISFDPDTGCQVVRFRFENPIEGKWLITIRGSGEIKSSYNIWIPKTGMISPGTELSPASPFTTIYNTSAASGVIAIGCYNKQALSACASSGRGFTRDNRVSPDYIVDGVDVPGPLPANKWGTIASTGPSSAIAAGVTAIIYEYQLAQGEALANTPVMKAILAEGVRRESTVSYPNPSSGYGVIDIN